MKQYKFNTWQESARIALLKKLAQAAGFVGYVNTQTEIFVTNTSKRRGGVCLHMEDIGTNSARCQLMYAGTGEFVHKIGAFHF